MPVPDIAGAYSVVRHASDPTMLGRIASIRRTGAAGSNQFLLFNERNNPEVAGTGQTYGATLARLSVPAWYPPPALAEIVVRAGRVEIVWPDHTVWRSLSP